jgi:hypothetical protein
MVQHDHHHTIGNKNAVVRGGKKLDKDLVLFHEKLAEKHAMYAMAQAKALWDNALDGNKITERERSTLRYIMAKFPFEKSAMVWLADMVDPPASSTKEFVFTEGIKIHRPVWDEAHRVTQDSIMDIEEAREMMKMVDTSSGKVSMEDANTIWCILNKLHCSEATIKFLRGELTKFGYKADFVPAKSAHAPTFNMTNQASSEAVWQCVKKQNAFLYKQPANCTYSKLVCFSKEASNVRSISTYTYSGIANADSITVVPGGGADDLKVSVTAEGKTSVLKGHDAKQMARKVEGLARKDLKAAAMSKATHIHKALRTAKGASKK